MDIIDIDEALKDDSFIFLEEKTHDDICNILQQWKTNINMPPTTNTSHESQQQLQREQAHKYDSRTFTRPKRKFAQNLQLQFPNNQQQQNAFNMQPDNPMLKLEIGGLVTNMQKSFLQDTSPPPFSSMDVSIDRMSNSLITSADFTNINFLQSTNSLNLEGPDTVGLDNFNLTAKVTKDGYSLSDMIRDREALESLTMSSDGTLIKDSHIGQIDEISLTLSKTASGCSTMDSSTESVETNNRTIQINNGNVDRAFSCGVELELAEPNRIIKSENSHATDDGTDNQLPNALQRTMILSDEMIGDITYNLIENSMYASIPTEQALNVTKNLQQVQNSTSENLPASIMNETICLSMGGGGGKNNSSNAKIVNSTFDCQDISSDTGCETPENTKKTIEVIKYYESTPQSSTARCNKTRCSPTLKMIYDGNISPIVPTRTKTSCTTTTILNETFENGPQNLNNITKNVISKNSTFSEKSHSMTNVEMIESIENPTLDKTFKRLEHQNPASLEMKNVIDLAEAEANLLASNNNEEEFDHMLDEFSKVELNAEQLKMKKSLDSIKRRFNYGPNRDKLQQRDISRDAKDMRGVISIPEDILGEDNHFSKDCLNMTIDGVAQDRDELKKSKENLLESPHALSETSSEMLRSPFKDSVSSSSITDSKMSIGLSSSPVSTASNGGERLLSRRSRLYDGFHMSSLSPNSMQVNKTSLGASFTVHKEDDFINDIRPDTKDETELLNDQNSVQMVQEKTETPLGLLDKVKDTTSVDQYRLTEKRERDRDRFKTIKINKIRNEDANCEDGIPVSELNVPCIDNYPLDLNVKNSSDTEQFNQRASRRDQTSASVFNNKKSECDDVGNKTTSKTNPNFLTYKKPKEKQQSSNIQNLPEVTTVPLAVQMENEKASSKPRSLSRPRYLSGLTKFSSVSKATSADELEKTIPGQTNHNTTTYALNIGFSKGSSVANVSLNRTQIMEPSCKQTAEIKSPMGIKSKSFHNLSSHLTIASASNNTVESGGGITGLKTFGLRKPTAIGISSEKLAPLNQNSYLTNPSSSQNPVKLQLNNMKSDESVFKVPKLVSGIRAPGVTKRTGLVRPSSGYYSLAITAKALQPSTLDTECNTGSHSPTDSMSSLSSKGSAQSVNKTAVVKNLNTSNSSTAIKVNATANITKNTNTGIPKPSGLKPPSNIKRSGLPRPSSFIKN